VKLLEVLVLLVAVVLFAWWQLRDLAQEKKRREQRSSGQQAPGPQSPPQPGQKESV
jgi:hypothetical protein